MTSSPFMIRTFWSVATPGTTLCLLDGTYRGEGNMIAPSSQGAPPGLSGTSTKPITIRALNDGQVLLDGQFQRAPVYLSGNSWFILEGFNARNGRGAIVNLSNGSNNNIVRRVVAWDAHIGMNSKAFLNCDAAGNLFEDIAFFGTFTQGFMHHCGGTSGTVRRAWGRWEGSTTNWSQKEVYNLAYGRSLGLWCENCIATSNGMSMPASYRVTDNVGNAATANPGCAPGHTGITSAWQCPETLFRNKGDVGDPNPYYQNLRVYGSLAYLGPTDKWEAPGYAAFNTNQRTEGSGQFYRHNVAFIHPQNPRFNALWGFYFATHGSSQQQRDLIANNLTSVRGSSGNLFQSPWNVQQLSAGTSLGAVANPWTTNGAGANLCYRWTPGGHTPSTTPLWPWPMNERIKAATAMAGSYSGPCLDCTGGRAVRTPTDVTADIEALLGAIPARCRTDR